MTRAVARGWRPSREPTESPKMNGHIVIKIVLDPDRDTSDRVSFETMIRVSILFYYEEKSAT